MILLKRGRGHDAGSRGWLLLVIPCPVCASVILFSVAFFISLFPDQRRWAAAGLYLAFVGIAFFSLAVIGIFRRGRSGCAETHLGGAMLLMAAYFLLSVTVVPQFADLERRLPPGLQQTRCRFGQPVCHRSPGPYPVNRIRHRILAQTKTDSSYANER